MFIYFIASLHTFSYSTLWWILLTLMCYIQFCAQLISLIHCIKVNTMILIYKCMCASVLHFCFHFSNDSIITFPYITLWWTVLTLMCYLQFCAPLISPIHLIMFTTMIAFYKCMSTSILLLKVIISYSTIRTFLYITLLWKVLTLICYL